MSFIDKKIERSELTASARRKQAREVLDQFKDWTTEFRKPEREFGGATEQITLPNGRVIETKVPYSGWGCEPGMAYRITKLDDDGNIIDETSWLIPQEDTSQALP